MKREEMVGRGPAWMACVLFSRVRDAAFDLRDSLSRDPFASIHAAVRPYTQCGNARLRSLYEAIRTVVKEGVLEISSSVAPLGVAAPPSWVSRFGRST